MEFLTLKEIYDNSIRSFGSRPASALLDRETMTYDDFAGRVEHLRSLLLGAGLRGGDKVALVSGSMPNWSVCYFAAVTAGMVVVPVLPEFSGPELDMIIAHSEAKALLVSDKLYSRISHETVERMNIVIRTKNLGVIARTCSEQGAAREPEPDDLAAIIYTSGTTSAPKGVMLTHRNLAVQIQMERDLFMVHSDDVFLSILPLAHTYECSVGMLLPFMCGASVVYVDRPPTVSNLLPALAQVRPTIMLSVPLVIEKIYKKQVAARFEKNRLLGRLYSVPFFRRRLHAVAGKRLFKLFGGRLRFFGIGGAKLDASAERFLMEGKFPYAIGYGLTETAPLIAGAVPGKVRPGSTGPVMPGIEARLDNMNENGEGELVVKSPCTMQGYYRAPELTAAAFTADGWFRTHDLCSFDGDGCLYVHGRLGNMIVGPSGENIYPEDIESVLNSHFLVADSLVQEYDGRLVALVHFDRAAIEQRYHELRDDLSERMEEIKSDLIKYVNSKVSKFSRISRIEEQAQDFEKTPSHKIKRYLYNRNKQTRQ